MNANELADELVEISLIADNHTKMVLGIAEEMIRQQQAELDSLRSVVYWLKENRPEVWDDIKKWSKM